MGGRLGNFSAAGAPYLSLVSLSRAKKGNVPEILTLAAMIVIRSVPGFEFRVVQEKMRYIHHLIDYTMDVLHVLHDVPHDMLREFLSKQRCNSFGLFWSGS